MREWQAALPGEPFEPGALAQYLPAKGAAVVVTIINRAKTRPHWGGFDCWKVRPVAQGRARVVRCVTLSHQRRRA